ncbi:hypothetical protein FNF29_04884 [Cafeteria roenbergensis]|uniref:EF-hand domain-containing protein n=1 Tax=Cafeteria roenbergensis TaxID=33653 RepID=A0A5A8CEK5_CAFRO|nr:hypothetical protein FNF29_04884 [Cafeteria roenbergensis]|eukprot:KAA0150994.1 hypothetical protein FNF29_04884 [Cafeteria roenbergensis]
MSGLDAATLAALNKDGINKDKAEEYHAAFRVFTRGSEIRVENLRAVLEGSFGASYTESDYQYMLRQFSGDQDTDVVTFPVFAKSMHSKMGNPAYNEAYGDAFDLLLKESGDVELTAGLLKEGMAKLGEDLTDAEAAEMVKAASKKNEFVKLMSESGGVTGGGPAAVAAGGAPAGGVPAAATFAARVKAGNSCWVRQASFAAPRQAAHACIHARSREAR